MKRSQFLQTSFIGLFTAFLTSCSCNPDPMHIEGRIVQSCDDPTPIQGVVVYYDSDEDGTLKDTTDMEGRFSISTNEPGFCAMCPGFGLSIMYRLNDSTYFEDELNSDLRQSVDYKTINFKTARYTKFVFQDLPDSVSIPSGDSLLIRFPYSYQQPSGEKYLVLAGPIDNTTDVDPVLVNYYMTQSGGGDRVGYGRYSWFSADILSNDPQVYQQRVNIEYSDVYPFICEEDTVLAKFGMY